MAKKFMYVCFGILALVVAFHLGATYTGAAVPGTEIAIEKARLYDGELVPLPYYDDGTQAAEEECTWVVIPAGLRSGHNATLGFECYVTPERTLFYKQYTIEGEYSDSPAVALVVAMRAGATSTGPTTWGQIKAEFGE